MKAGTKSDEFRFCASFLYAITPKNHIAMFQVFFWTLNILSHFHAALCLGAEYRR